MGLTRRACLVLAFFTASLAAIPAPACAQEEVGCEGPLQEDSLRYPEARVVKRTLFDIAAVPASVVAWDDADWARFGAFTIPSFAMMWPTKPSFDVYSFDWVQAHRKPALDHFFVKLETIPESVFLASYGAILFGTAWISKNKRLFEFGTLALESLAIAQLYHSSIKLLVGREGPAQAKGGEPHIYGPTQVFFPAGTPSGHAATDFAMLFVLADYWGKWPLYVFAGVAGIYLGASFVYNGQHYVSDVILGAGMGIYIARWIVRHRSTRYRCRGKSSRVSLRERLTFLPVLAPNGLLLTVTLRQ
jgi:membrane-associated phospholipid phosphatase